MCCHSTNLAAAVTWLLGAYLQPCGRFYAHSGTASRVWDPRYELPGLSSGLAAGNAWKHETTMCCACLQVVGPKADAARIPGIDVQLGDGDTFKFGEFFVHCKRHAQPVLWTKILPSTSSAWPHNFKTRLYAPMQPIACIVKECMRCCLCTWCMCGCVQGSWRCVCLTPQATHAATSHIGSLGPRLCSQVSLAVLAVQWQI